MINKKNLNKQEYIFQRFQRFKSVFFHGKSSVQYKDYSMNFQETMVCLGKGFGILAIISYIFYRSYLSFVLLSPIIVLFYIFEKKALLKKSLWQLNLEFRDMLLSVTAGLQAGYSVENAFVEAKYDIRAMYGRQSRMLPELNRMEIGLKNNIPLEKILEDLANRSDIEDIREFSEIFVIAKRNGGNLNALLKFAAEKINEKVQVQEDIGITLSAKQYEIKILSTIPFFLVAYINLTSPGFFDCLYYNLKGICIMTVCLLLYGLALVIAEKIVRIVV